MIIIPTVGRIVWFYESKAMHEQQAEEAAIVTAVQDHGQRVCLTVFPARSQPKAVLPVPLIQEGCAIPEDGPFCMWMPYQVGQAKRQVEQEVHPETLAMARAGSTS